LDMRLSEHFVDKWRELFKKEPSVQEVLSIIQDPRTVWVQKCMDMLHLSGKPYRTLRTYINFDRRIAIKVDEISKKVVTFVAEEPKSRNGFK